MQCHALPDTHFLLVITSSSHIMFASHNVSVITYRHSWSVVSFGVWIELVQLLVVKREDGPLHEITFNSLEERNTFAYLVTFIHAR